MASISNDPNGRRRILFFNDKGERKTIRLGVVSLRHAESVKLKIEDLVSASITGNAPRDETARWVVSLGSTMHDKLANAGLVKPRESAKLDEFIGGYLAQRVDLKPATMVVMEQARRHLVRFLGAGTDIRQIMPADADHYKAHLLGRKSARSTVNKWIRYARHFFEVAKRRGLIETNPFGHISAAVKGDPTKRQFIAAEDVAKVVHAAPDPQWKLLVALARWGGLRVPSEALALTWRDVDFEHRRFIIRSTKTAHHEDGGVRVVPMFPELTEHFQRVFDEAATGSVYVISRYRDPAANLRTQLCRYIEAAGLKPWPKPWQNLRVSRATELADQYPSHVSAAWLGHSEKIADAFYRQVTDDHFARAVAQNAAQKVHESSRKHPQQHSADVPQPSGLSKDSENVP
ncbi:MAG: tyrosine-type recombinase/integrase, partial [Chloroflexota bacterium]